MPFDYMGHTFTPYKTLRGGAATFRYISRHISDEKQIIDCRIWNYERFYEAAGEKGYDLFECDGLLWMPGERALFLWIGNE